MKAGVLDRRLESPARFVNALLALSALFLLSVLIVASLVKHPHTIDGRVVLVSNSRPYDMFAPQSGKLVLLASPGDSVRAASDIAYVFKSTDYDAISSISDALRGKDWERIYRHLSQTEAIEGSGELSGACCDLRQSLHEWFNLEAICQFQSKVDLMEAKDSLFRSRLEIESRILHCESLTESQLVALCSEDSLLFSEGSLPKAQLEQSLRSVLQQQHKVETIKSGMLSLRQELFQNALELSNVKDEMRVRKEVLRQEVEEKIASLLASIDLWRSQSVIVAPQDGYFELYPNVSDGQMVVSGTQVVRAMTFDDGMLRGEMQFDSKEAGALKGGEVVKITMDSYPPNQYGYLCGDVISYSSSLFVDPNASSAVRTALVSINLKEQPYWWTDLNYVHGMTGKSEIIVEERSLLEQVFNFIVANVN